MLLSFDVDCGEIAAGHRFIARGLSQAATHDPRNGSEPVPCFSLEYELAPGVPVLADKHGIFGYLVPIAYSADVPLPWEPSDGGAIAPFDGAATTHGSRGSYPLPDGARMLTFTLYDKRVSGFGSETEAGRLLVDLDRGAAWWEPS